MGRYAATVEDRFAKFVPSWGESVGCWEWTGARVGHMGYGHMRYRGGSALAHRVSYLEHVGPIGDGLVVMHLCDNPLCVRPSHLRLGTVAENQADMVSKGRNLQYVGRRRAATLARPCSKCGGPRVLQAGNRVRCPRGACRGGQ